MADLVHPLVLVAGDGAGICDPETGTCALPERDGEPGAAVSDPQ